MEVERKGREGKRALWSSVSEPSQRVREATKAVETVDNSRLAELVALADKPVAQWMKTRKPGRDGKISRCVQCGSWTWLGTCGTCSIAEMRAQNPPPLTRGPEPPR